MLPPGAFDVLQTVWVKAVGIPDNGRTEAAVTELAYLVAKT